MIGVLCAAGKLRGSVFKHSLLLFFLVVASVAVKAQVPVAEFTANQRAGCAPLVVTFQDQSTGSPTSWNWGFSNGQLSTVQNPTVTFTQPGTYSVSLVVQNSDGTHGITKTDYITVYPSPQPGFTANITTGCVPVTIQFTDASVPMAGNITSWEWNFGDGNTSTQQNPVHTYTAVGFYSVSLRVTSSTGCAGVRTQVRYIRIVPGVTAEFSNSEAVRCTAPFAINFTNLTSGPGSMSYDWDFGNSTNSTITDPTANYAAAGTYNVRLIARSQFGCSDTIIKPVTLTSYTTSINAPDTACLNSPVSFQNSSSPAPASFIWDFGNGRQSTNINDTSSYGTPGNYTVKLINTYAHCVDSVTKPITVMPLPAVDFSAPNLTSCQAPFTVDFTDLSPDAIGWQWDFGDGNTSNQRNPSHTYQDTGRFNVTLTITSSKGCQNSITKPAYVQIVRARLAITNIPDGGCIPFAFDPAPNVTSIDGIASWFWDFGDGFTTTAANPAPHTYAGVGVWTLTLRVTTNGGCTETLVIPGAVTTGTPPSADFTINTNDTCSSSDITFTSITTPPITGWLWDFGDGTTSTDIHPTHSYSDTGSFNVTMRVHYNRCYSAPVIKPVHIKPPIAEFEFLVSNCNNKRLVNFTDMSVTDPAYGPVTYLWEFGDPANSTSAIQGDTLFTFPSLGDYQVRLTVTNGACSNTFTQLVRLVGDIANFNIPKPNVCKDEQFTITATGSIPANVSLYQWSLNGGPWTDGTSTYTNSLSANGSYSVGLRIVDINGCEDIKILPNAITVTGPTANFTTPNPGACAGSTIIFNDLSIPAGGITEWRWNYGDGQIQNLPGPPFSHVYNDTGRYVVSLTVRDNANCSHTYTMQQPIMITRPRVGFTSNYDSICPGVPLQFIDTSKGRGLTWRWDFGDGNTSTLQNPAHTYAAPDSAYTVKLVITDDVSCSDSITRVDYIAVRAPKPAFTVSDTTTICPPIETKFTFQGRDYESFYWDFGDSNTSTLLNPSNFYNTYGSYTAKLYLTGYGGCLDSAETIVNVHNPYTATSISYNPVHACNELLVDFAVTWPPSTKYTFYFGDGVIDTSQSATLQHHYTRPNYYYPFLVLTDNQDCQVSISGSPRIEVIGAVPLFGKDKKDFCDSGTVTFTNYTLAPNDPVTGRVWDFGDGNTASDEHPIHFYQQPGTYLVSQTVTTQQGCSNTITDTVRVHGTPYVQINGDSIVCINELLPLQGELIRPDTSITWAWNLGNGTTASNTTPSVTYGAAGSYLISLITSNLLNCRDTATKTVYVPQDPVISVGENPVIVVGNGITLPVTYSDSIATYTWTPSTGLNCVDCPVPYANPQFNTTYKISVEDVYGCKASQDITVTVICNKENYFVPNTFSPNGDGMNDIFAPRGKSIHRVNSMKIFNRWGELIWEKRNFMANDRTPSGGWDGTYKGRPAQQDVYIYIIEFVCDNAQIIPFKGNVTLIR